MPKQRETYHWSKRRRLEDMPPSEMIDEIFGLIGSGSLYFNGAQRLCQATCRDHGDNAAEAVRAFASLGASGNCSQNIERDAYVWLRQMFGCALEPSRIWLYLQSPGKIAASYEKVPVLSIHEVFSAVWHAGVVQRQVSLYGPNGESSLRVFWKNAMERLEWARKHPATQGKTLDELSMLFPFVLFADGVEVFTNDEFIVWCWAVHTTAASGDSWDTRFPILALETSRLKDHDVRDKVHADVANYIAWEMLVLESKCFPTKWYLDEDFAVGTQRHARRGDHLAGGFGGIFCGIKGDRKERRNIHRFARHYQATFVCDQCLAMSTTSLCSVPELWYTSFGVDAGWRKTLIDHETYISSERRLSPFIVVRGYRHELAFGDLMHDLFIGAGNHHVANHMVVLAEHGCVRDDENRVVWDFDNALNVLMLRLRRWCHAHKCRHPPLVFLGGCYRGRA